MRDCWLAEPIERVQIEHTVNRKFQRFINSGCLAKESFGKTAVAEASLATTLWRLEGSDNPALVSLQRTNYLFPPWLFGTMTVMRFVLETFPEPSVA